MTMSTRLGLLCCLVGILAAAIAIPLSAQNVQAVRPMVAPAPDVGQVAPDYRALYEKARANNQKLRAENADLKAQLASWTVKGGSLVHAYCESDTLSRTTAGARNDCAASGYKCEPTSGLCRTSATESAHCAGSKIYCATTNQCVNPDPRACPG